MGNPAARVGDMHMCPMVTPGTPPVPHVGGPILPPGTMTVLIGNLPAATVGNSCTCVGPPDTIVLGSFSVLIGGKPAARMGDSTAHGGKIAMGMPTVLIGGSPASYVPKIQIPKIKKKKSWWSIFKKAVTIIGAVAGAVAIVATAVAAAPILASGAAVLAAASAISTTVATVAAGVMVVVNLGESAYKTSQGDYDGGINSALQAGKSLLEVIPNVKLGNKALKSLQKPAELISDGLGTSETVSNSLSTYKKSEK